MVQSVSLDPASMSMDEAVSTALDEYRTWSQATAPDLDIQPRVYVSSDEFEAMRRPFKKNGRWHIRAKGYDAPLASPRRDAGGGIVFDLGD